MIKKLFSIPGLIVTIIIFILAYLGLWMVIRSTVVSGVTDYITELEAEGFQVEHGGLSIDGFPFSIDASSPKVVVSTARNTNSSVTNNWSIESSELDFYSSTLTPLSWSVRHRGDLGVDMRIGNRTRYMFDISPTNIDSDFAYSLSGKLKSFQLDLGRAQLNPLLGAEPAILGLAGLRTDLEVRSNIGALEVLAKDIVISQQLLGDAQDVLSQTISRLALNADIENWQLLETEGIENWLQSPSKITSDGWQIVWGNIDITGSFDLAFNKNLPEGIIRFNVKNADAFVGNFISLELMDSGFATQLMTVINNMEADEENRKSIEITIRDGVVKYGFFTLYKF